MLDGALIGAAGGALIAWRWEDGEQLLHFASLGAVAGGALGLAVAITAAVTGLDREEAAFTPSRRPGAVALVLQAATARDGSAVWMPALAGRY
jgi:hypothetical protein